MLGVLQVLYSRFFTVWVWVSARVAVWVRGSVVSWRCDSVAWW